MPPTILRRFKEEVLIRQCSPSLVLPQSHADSQTLPPSSWGGDGGYDQCRAMTGVDFDRVQFRFTLAVRVSLINKYMWSVHFFLSSF